MNTKEKLAYSVAEVGELLGIGRNKAYELVKRADFPKVNLNGRIIICKDELNTWLHNQSYADNYTSANGLSKC